jgi:hypothetical protein
MVDIPSVFWLNNTGVRILKGETRIFCVKSVDEFEIGSLCHLRDNTCEGLSLSGHCYHQDWFKG